MSDWYTNAVHYTTDVWRVVRLRKSTLRCTNFCISWVSI